MSNPRYPGYAGSFISWICAKGTTKKTKKTPCIDSPSIGFPMENINSIIFSKSKIHWIGLRENLQENLIFDGKHHGFL